MNSAELLAGVAPAPAASLLAALSGGPDSALAAWIATKVAPDRVRAVHVDHGTAASPSLAAAAATVAQQLGIRLAVVGVVVPAGPSWEGQARTARWEALEAARRPGEVIVTGHHVDDLAETTFSHLLRGAGAAGLAAMAASRDDIWRPLLATRRAAINSVVAELGLSAMADPANENPEYRRNRIRHDILPRLQNEMNPQLIPALARTAHTLADDDAELEAAVGPVPVRRDPWGAWKIPAPLIATAGPAIAARIVRRLLRVARPPHAGTFAEIAAARDVVDRRVARTEIGGGWQLELEGPWLVAHCGDVAAPAPAPLTLPGTVGYGPLSVGAMAAPSVLTRRTSLLDRDRVGESLWLREAAAGERIEIAGGSKPLHTAMAEAEIPRRLRSAWPVIEADGRIAAVAAVRSAPWARGTLGEEGVYEITVGEDRL